MIETAKHDIKAQRAIRSLMNHKSKSGESILILSIKNENQQLAMQTLQLGGNPNILNRKGNTPLIIASKKGNLKLVLVLLDAGAKIGIFNNFKSSALIEAAKKKKIEILKLLISKSEVCEILHENIFGETVYSICMREKMTEILELLATARKMPQSFQTSRQQVPFPTNFKKMLVFYEKINKSLKTNSVNAPKKPKSNWMEGENEFLLHMEENKKETDSEKALQKPLEGLLQHSLMAFVLKNRLSLGMQNRSIRDVLSTISGK